MNCEYVRKFYGVPAEIGLRVIYKKKPGVICDDGGNYVRVNFYDEKPGSWWNIHPTDPELIYLKEKGEIRKLTRSQKRYQEYRNADWFDGSFSEWLGIKNKA